MKVDDPATRKKRIKAFFKRHGRLPNRSGPYSEKKLNEALSRYCSFSGPIYDKVFHTWAKSKGYGRDTVAEKIELIWAWSKKHKKRPADSVNSSVEERRFAITLSSYVNPKKATYQKEFARKYDLKFPRVVGGNFLDLKGRKFNRLTALRVVGYGPKSGYIWECRCDCGEKTTAPASKIKSGERKSCGCISKEFLKPGNNRINLAGKKTKYFIVISPAPEHDVGRASHWRARCKCGNISILTAYQLNSGSVKSCGCIRAEKQFKTIENEAFRAQRAGARQRNYKWNLSKEEYLAIARKPCTYCGKISTRTNKATGATIQLNSVDRKNNEPHYKLENCQSACFRCQGIKSNKTHYEFVFSFMEAAAHWKKQKT